MSFPVILGIFFASGIILSSLIELIPLRKNPDSLWFYVDLWIMIFIGFMAWLLEDPFPLLAMPLIVFVIGQAVGKGTCYMLKKWVLDR